MVILRPMAQFGCFSASSTCTLFICSSRPSAERAAGSRQKNLVDLIPVLTVQALENGAVLAVHRKNAARRFSLASGMMICPAVTRVSLLASAISFPAFIAAIVGRITDHSDNRRHHNLRIQLRCRLRGVHPCRIRHLISRSLHAIASVLLPFPRSRLPQIVG